MYTWLRASRLSEGEAVPMCLAVLIRGLYLGVSLVRGAANTATAAATALITQSL